MPHRCGILANVDYELFAVTGRNIRASFSSRAPSEHYLGAQSQMCLQNARCASLIVFGRLVTKLASLTESLFPPDVLAQR